MFSQAMKMSRSRWIQLLIFLALLSAIFLSLPQSTSPHPWNNLTGDLVVDNLDDSDPSPAVQKHASNTPPNPLDRTLGFGRIYVINIASRTDRRQVMTAIAKYLNLDFSFISATLTNDPVVRTLHNRTGLKRVVLACYRSHMSVYEDVVAKNLTSALVLEDDIDVEADLTSRVAALLPYLPVSWEMLYLGNCNPGNPQESDGEPLPGNPILRKSKLPYCTHSYAVSAKGAVKLLGLLAEPTIAVDVQIARNIRDGKIEAFSVVPVMTTQSRDSPSDISKNWKEMHADLLEDSVLARLKKEGLLEKGKTEE
ncbi:hypothetical protein BC938DRAFT_475633 [Jimgerdemannia flammicorona]|uniref:Glycosyl transferase family 25 domain-containing protein n=1 Tax=Jimgerdemannia flammicorona TaxID=994334 RepID=A0A433QRF1_9FUNG|nr:hypothetical protein BC938DRAFT_475633 [Jimgerdemannia flammicorona]